MFSCDTFNIIPHLSHHILSGRLLSLPRTVKCGCSGLIETDKSVTNVRITNTVEHFQRQKPVWVQEIMKQH
jgi:hypothetical protein